MTFEEELQDLVEHARIHDSPWEELEAAVVALHRRHEREVLPPIIGTMAVIEPKDELK